MDILLRIVNRRERKELFIDKNLKTYSQEAIVSRIKKQDIANLSLAKKNGRTYIRSKPNTKTTDNISCRSVSQTELTSFYKNYSKALTNQKIKEYDSIRRKKQIDILKQPMVLAYLYSYGYTKDIKGATKKRSKQISTEFYQMAKTILR